MVTVEAEVIEELAGYRYRLRLPDGTEMIAYSGNRLRQRQRRRAPHSRAEIGDRVEVEYHESDSSSGRIVRILKG